MKFNSSVLIQSALTGMGIGFAVTLLCMALIGGFNAVILELLVWLVASALFGILSGVIFYSKNDLPLPAAMALHCGGCFLVAICAAAVNGYSDDLMGLVTAIAPVFLVIYAAIYAVCFAIMKHHEKQINKALNQK